MRCEKKRVSTVSTIFVLGDNLWESSLIQGCCKKSWASNTWNMWEQGVGKAYLLHMQPCCSHMSSFLAPFHSPINMECLLAGNLEGEGGMEMGNWTRRLHMATLLKSWIDCTWIIYLIFSRQFKLYIKNIRGSKGKLFSDYTSKISTQLPKSLWAMCPRRDHREITCIYFDFACRHNFEYLLVISHLNITNLLLDFWFRTLSSLWVLPIFRSRNARSPFHVHQAMR